MLPMTVLNQEEISPEKRRIIERKQKRIMVKKKVELECDWVEKMFPVQHLIKKGNSQTRLNVKELQKQIRSKYDKLEASKANGAAGGSKKIAIQPIRLIPLSDI